MKKQIAVAMGLAVLSTSAFATKARLIALGEDQDGSWFINDNRNVWLNASAINNHKDQVIMEWGSDNSGSDTDTGPQAEGGFFGTMGNLAYGVYLGREQRDRATRRNDHTSAALHQDNNVDLVIGGDAGIQWGVNIGYSSGKDEQQTPNNEQTSTYANIGLNGGNWDAIINLNITDEFDIDDQNSYDGDLGYKLGFGYTFGASRAWVSYDMQSYDIKEASTTATEYERTEVEIGYGHTKNLNDKAKLFTSVRYVMSDLEVTSGGTTQERSNFWIPLTVGLEVDALSWLAVRGSVTQRIFGEEENLSTNPQARPFANSTNVNVGATLKFGNLEIDGVVGTSNNGTVGDTDSETGVLALDNVMSRVGMTYRF